MAPTIECDVAIVGGGLSGCLIALALAERRPALSVRLIEGDPVLGGNHIWSFFGSDVAKDDRWLLTPLISKAWPGYDIAFPELMRHIEQPYYSITSEQIDRVTRARLAPGSVMTGEKALGVSPTAVVLGDGRRVEARGVIDCRGPGHLNTLELGWQKFLGRELRLTAPHGLEHPVVMDATVEQIDGYRFVYLLPFGENRIFVEDTYYSDQRRLDRTAVSKRIDAYVQARGWSVAEVTREEAGSLPVVIGGDFEAYWRSGGNKVAKGGVRAGLFHPTTGYSLPDAVRAAIAVTRADDISGAALHDLLYGRALAAWRGRRFYRMLDAMLFRAAEPKERWRIMQRFYSLDAKLIGRFYAARSTLADKARILTGKPPVPIARAIAAIRGSRTA